MWYCVCYYLTSKLWWDISVKIKGYCIFIEGGGGYWFHARGLQTRRRVYATGGRGGTIYTRGFTSSVGVLFKLGGAL